MMMVVIINKRLLNGLNSIDKGENSYQYLLAFNQWIKKQVAINKKMSTFLYPVIFMSLIIGFWFKDAEGIPLGERLVGEVLYGFPDIYMIHGIPLIGIVVAFLILGLLAFFGGRIYLWDVNIVYGRIFKKLDELLADLESLRS